MFFDGWLAGGLWSADKVLKGMLSEFNYPYKNFVLTPILQSFQELLRSKFFRVKPELSSPLDFRRLGRTVSSCEADFFLRYRGARHQMAIDHMYSRRKQQARSASPLLRPISPRR